MSAFMANAICLLFLALFASWYFLRRERLEEEKKLQGRQADPRVRNTPIDPK
jgi:hypothetical protein